MSLPSLVSIIAERGITDITTVSDVEREEVVVEAMRRDLPLAVEYLHNMTHASQHAGGHVRGVEDPNSPLGKQLTRICAGTVLREFAQKHFCHGQEISFINCCGPVVGPERPPLRELVILQIAMQDGTIAYADC